MTHIENNHKIVRQKYRKWTMKDIEFLKVMYPVSTVPAIAKEMGITPLSVKSAMERYKITQTGLKLGGRPKTKKTYEIRRQAPVYSWVHILE